MEMKKEIKRMQKALDAYLASEQRAMTEEELKAKAWFPVHIGSVSKSTDEELEQNAFHLMEGLRDKFIEEEMAIFATNLKKFATFLNKCIYSQPKKV